MKTVQKIFHCITYLFGLASRILFIIVFTETFLMTVLRYFFKYSPIWSDQVTIFCMAWLFMLSSVSAHRDDKAFRLRMISGRLSERGRFILRLIEDVLVTICCFVCFMPSVQAVENGKMISLMGLPLNFSHVRLSMVVFYAGYILTNIERYLMHFAGIPIEPVLVESDDSK